MAAIVFPPFWRPLSVEPERTLWDIVYLDGTALPGVCTCKINATRAIETVHEKGKDGVSQKDNGYKGALVEIGITIWKEEQLVELNKQIPDFHPRKTGAASGPVSLEHPTALLLGVTGIRITKINVPTPTSGMLLVLISAIEFFPLASIKKSNKGGGKGAKKTTGGFPPKTGGGPFGSEKEPPPSPTTGADFP